MYWFFDNLQILGKLKSINVVPAEMGKKAMFAWWVGILFNLVISFRKLYRSTTQRRKIIDLLRESPEKATEFKSKLNALDATISECLIAIVKNLGDLLPSSAGWGIFIRTPRKTRS